MDALFRDREPAFDWNDLRYFLAVYRRGSLARAARTLGVVPTTVGRRLESLETALGQTLFARTPSGHVPTHLAERLSALAADVETRILALHHTVVDTGDEISGNVSVATFELLSSHVLAPRLVTLIQRHPQLQVELRSRSRDADLVRKPADVSLHRSKPQERSLRVVEVGRLELGLYAAPELATEHGLVRGQTSFDGVPLVSYPDAPVPTIETEWLMQRTADPYFRVRANSATVLQEAIAAGLGAGILPNFMGAERDLVEISDAPVLTREIYAAVHEDLRHVASVQTVIDWIRDSLTAIGAGPTPV